MSYSSSNLLLIILAFALGVSTLATWPQAPDLSAIPPLPSQQSLTAPARLVLGLKIPLHEASAKDLAYLPGLGVMRAQTMVDFLQAHGPITQFDALLQIPGIGPKTLAKIQPYLEL